MNNSLSPEQQKLAQLEADMFRLVLRRQDRIAKAEAEIKKANKDFDKASVPLARQINRLRDELAPVEEQQAQPTKRVTRTADPEWPQEDQDHFYELQQREARRGR